MNFRGGVLALGHILVDLFAVAPSWEGFPGRAGAPLHLHGEAMEGLLRRLDHLARTGGARVERRAGGGQALVALASKALGLEASLVACAGADAEGDFLRSCLAATGLQALVFEGDSRTGVFACLSEQGGGKRIVVAPGAAAEIRGREIPDALFRPGWILSLDGLLVDAPDWLWPIARRARGAGMEVALDLSTPGNARALAGELRAFAENCCDLIFANEAEFAALEAVTGRLENPKALWIVKLGRRGAKSFKGGESWAAPLDAAASGFDTGAGDFFAAGYLCGRLGGHSEAACLDLGNRAAALLVASEGGELPLAALPGLLF